MCDLLCELCVDPYIDVLNLIQLESSHFTRYQTLFTGNCYFCNNFGNKATICTTCIRDNAERDRFYSKEIYRKNESEGLSKNIKEDFNFFSPLSSYNGCQNCGNYGHKNEYVTNQSSSSKPVENIFNSTKVSQKNSDHQNQEGCSLALHAQNKRGQWYTDSVCSNHMSGDKEN